MNEAAADGGWGLGPAYRFKPATKPGFETVIMQFEAMAGVRARISPVGSERGGHFAHNSPGHLQCAQTQMLPSLPPFSKTHSGSDNLARCGALESLVNDMADDTWDNKAVNRTSAIHFLDDGEDDDDEKVRVTGSSSPLAFLLRHCC